MSPQGQNRMSLDTQDIDGVRMRNMFDRHLRSFILTSLFGRLFDLESHGAIYSLHAG